MLFSLQVIHSKGFVYIKCHHEDQDFRQKSYAACHIIFESDHQIMLMSELIQTFSNKFNETLTEQLIETMKHAIEVIIIIHLWLYSTVLIYNFAIHFRYKR